MFIMKGLKKKRPPEGGLLKNFQLLKTDIDLSVRPPVMLKFRASQD